jgi:putative selenate reductase
LIDWIMGEHKAQGSIFGIPGEKFHRHQGSTLSYDLFGETLETPFGPAAGPHTQLSQNLVSAYLTGCRFFELKTVQVLDSLEFDKPCIDAFDEGYNTEWSQELSLDDAFDEYLKSWVLLYFLKRRFGLSDGRKEPGFIFNMSVGYDLKGIQSARMDNFINRMLHPGEPLERYLSVIGRRFPDVPLPQPSEGLVSSVTISTMHGCPPEEIEQMARYLIGEKNLNTYVKLNPTLLGKEKVLHILKTCGYDYIEVGDETFSHDLQYADAVSLIRNLGSFAQRRGKCFGVKLSNTLAIRNPGDVLPGDERYMSGRPLFPITIHLAAKLAEEFDGRITISFSAGASRHNIRDILDTNIFPVTMTTDILKPGGYLRFSQIAGELEKHPRHRAKNRVNVKKLKQLAQRSMENEAFLKKTGKPHSIKLESELGLFDCITAPCVDGCPIHQDIPEYIDLINRKDYTEALLTILKKNPLPNITGYICDHNCVLKCVRWDYDNPISIRELKRIAARKGRKDLVFSRIAEEVRAKQGGKRVGIIGGGPAGMAAGYFLAREGFAVTLFESRKNTGGTVRASIPRFRLPDRVIDDDLSILRALGVVLKTGCTESYSIDDLKQEGYDYLILTTGSAVPKALNIGDQGVTQGYYRGMEFLERIKSGEELFVGKKVLIIGGGNSAVDAARAALRYGPEFVWIIYRRDLANMPADREEIDACREEGIEIKQLLGPKELIVKNGHIRGLRCTPMKLGDPDGSGRPRPVPLNNGDLSLSADTVIAAVGEALERETLSRNMVALTSGGTVQVNPQTGETNIPGVYAGGDCVRGPATVVEAIADAKKITCTILEKEGLTMPGHLTDTFYQKEKTSATQRQEAKHGVIERFDPVEKLPLARRNNFDTVIRTLRENNALRESHRCLQCSRICNKCVETCPNRANIGIMFSPVPTSAPLLKPIPLNSDELPGVGVPGQDFVVEQTIQILHIDDFCNDCGNCETFCPHQGKPYRDKPTLFSGKESFLQSENSGFYLASKWGGHQHRFVCRVGKQLFDMEMDTMLNTLLFRAGTFSLVFNTGNEGGAPVLKEYSYSGRGVLQTADMIGLYLIIDTLIRRYSYLFGYTEEDKT